ncbi:hypothetical protein DIURU_000070 [Diutina rugosa]|uniref:Uncharacterized protein n=1 Tax=Diutina rugosa TaxID=5481 RepID=A0A642V1I0_DIURU|nr:uncharacterized protein DIURU_000070 [Diutina rugosa]KAA8908757.1 hypothetical protein DIURU_000070 [Diutina rugosa]
MLPVYRHSGVAAFRVVGALAQSPVRGPDPARKANLGDMVQQLRLRVPGLLHHSLPKSMVSPDVVLRVCPTQYHGYLPQLKGHVPYYATCKALQLVLSSVVLNSRARIHIQSLKIGTDDTPSTLIPGSTKIGIKWTTCDPRCPHLDGESSSAARLGSHTWKGVDFTGSVGLGALKGLVSNPTDLDRVISGVFVFELNPQCDQILVHSIEDVETLEKEMGMASPRLQRAVNL